MKKTNVPRSPALLWIRRPIYLAGLFILAFNYMIFNGSRSNVQSKPEIGKVSKVSMDTETMTMTKQGKKKNNMETIAGSVEIDGTSTSSNATNRINAKEVSASTKALMDEHPMDHSLLKKIPYLEQIEKDLNPFSKNITLDMIQKANELEYTVRVQYINQTLYSYPVHLDNRGDISDSRSRTSVFVKLLQDTVKRYKTPDFDMVINLHDGPRACGSSNLGVSIFSFQKTETCRDILIPCAVVGIGSKRFDDEIDHLSEKAKNYSWSQKMNKIIWRGSSTGGIWDNTNLDTMVRYRIFVECEKVELQNVCDVGLSRFTQTKAGITIDNPKIIFRDQIPMHEWMKYKYEVVLDGNGSPAGRIDRQLAHNSLLLMQETEHFQMYTKYMKPFVHYVPLQRNISDLGAAYQWASENEEKVLMIIHAANGFAQYLKRESILYYTHVLLTKYSSTLSFKPRLESGYVGYMLMVLE